MAQPRPATAPNIMIAPSRGDTVQKITTEAIATARYGAITHHQAVRMATLFSVVWSPLNRLP